MPTRLLRDWTDSETMAKLSAFEEVFFTRLLMKADDYGRYHANTQLLRSLMFPLNAPKESQLEAALEACARAGLIRVYVAVNGKRCLEIVKFGQTVRAKASKFPANDSLCTQLFTDAPVSNKIAPVVVSVSESVCVSELQKTTTPVAAQPEIKRFVYPDDFEQFWKFYPNSANKGGAFKAWKKLDADSKLKAIDRAEWWKGCWEHNDPHGERSKFIPHAATWLNSRRFDDSDEAVELQARGR